MLVSTVLYEQCFGRKGEQNAKNRYKRYMLDLRNVYLSILELLARRHLLDARHYGLPVERLGPGSLMPGLPLGQSTVQVHQALRLLLRHFLLKSYRLLDIIYGLILHIIKFNLLRFEFLDV